MATIGTGQPALGSPQRLGAGATPAPGATGTTAATGAPPLAPSSLGQQTAAQSSPTASSGVTDSQGHAARMALGEVRTAPAIRDNGSAAPANGGVKDTTTDFKFMTPDKQREAFSARMKAAGVTPSEPPTQEELQKYFKTFNDPKKRAQAASEFQDYATAFHVHIASSDNGNSSSDVVYSKESHFFVGKKRFPTEEAAQKEANRVRKDYTKFETSDASSWQDVSSDRKTNSDGRKIQDCEGFAYMAQTLLGAAGYKSTQVANGSHAMTVFKDPSGGNTVVTSNERAFSGKNEAALLEQGWTSAGGSGETKWYRGATQAEAQAQYVIDQPDS